LTQPPQQPPQPPYGQPPYGPPPYGGPQYPPGPPYGAPPPYGPPQRPKRRRTGLIVLLSTLGALLLIVVVAVAASSSSTSTGAAASNNPLPGSSQAASQPTITTPSPTPTPAQQTVTYTVTGNAPSGDLDPSITYGPSGSNINGAVPLNVTQPIGANPPAYYAISVQLSDAGGNVVCQILIDGKVIDQQTAQGADQIANCEVTQDPFSGNWQSANSG
jgi:hypothetical protein